jgi:hypothetical protein
MIVAIVLFMIAIIGLLTDHGVLAYFCFCISGVVFCPACYFRIRKITGADP